MRTFNGAKKSSETQLGKENNDKMKEDALQSLFPPLFIVMCWNTNMCIFVSGVKEEKNLICEVQSNKILNYVRGENMKRK